MLWAGAISGLPVSGYLLMSAVFYAWLNAAEPERWPVEKAALWAGSAFILGILCFGFFIYCVVVLIKASNTNYRARQNAS